MKLKLVVVFCFIVIQASAQNYPILWEDHFEDDDFEALKNVGWIYYPERDIQRQFVGQVNGELVVEAGSYGGLVGMGLVETNGVPLVTLDGDGDPDHATVPLLLENSWSSPNQILTVKVKFESFTTSLFEIATRMPIDTRRGDSDPTEAPAYAIYISPLEDYISMVKYSGSMALFAPNSWTYFEKEAFFDFNLDEYYWIKWYLNEGDLKFKIWQGEEADEPGAWFIEAVDPDPRVTGTFTMFSVFGSPPGTNEDGDLFVLDDVVMRSSFENSSVPVEMSLFTAQQNDKKIFLSWWTESETNNYGFYVERKALGDWQEVGFVTGSGTTIEQHNYSFLDDYTANDGPVYYRLKQVDYDASYKYSNIITVNPVVPASFKLEQNYPNPFNSSTVIKYELAERSFIDCYIINLEGQIIKTLVHDEKNAGVYSLHWHGQDAYGSPVASGVYFLVLEADNVVKTQKITLLR